LIGFTTALSNVLTVLNQDVLTFLPHQRYLMGWPLWNIQILMKLH